jgi:hypothetical protein
MLSTITSYTVIAGRAEMVLLDDQPSEVGGLRRCRLAVWGFAAGLFLVMRGLLQGNSNRRGRDRASRALGRGGRAYGRPKPVTKRVVRGL